MLTPYQLDAMAPRDFITLAQQYAPGYLPAGVHLSNATKAQLIRAIRAGMAAGA